MVLGEKLEQLEELDKLARSAMDEIFRVVAEEETPRTFFSITRRLQETRGWIGVWKALATREGGRQAWEMLSAGLEISGGRGEI